MEAVIVVNALDAFHDMSMVLRVIDIGERWLVDGLPLLNMLFLSVVLQRTCKMFFYRTCYPTRYMLAH